MEQLYCLKPIGYVRRGEGVSREEIVEIILYDEYMGSLKGLEDYSHAILLYYMHLAKWNGELIVNWQGHEVGVFATRSPVRPNPIGLSVVEIIKVYNTSLKVKGINAYNGTPVLDIKPYDYWDRPERIKVPEWHPTTKHK
ncbi:MAG: tRNA (N6-threonylcarbamoyladenosine(37)-N6)-methyltransferase TrmO [Sulfolobus sp.]|nr:tRNA (N6-threonylcarbamoyladenosine(37)-N6)-methyltransferase TrmO [Sulfolobus sp.]